MIYQNQAWWDKPSQKKRSTTISLLPKKKTLTKGVEKITWTHKLSTATTNLEAVDIEEIQIFHIALRELNDLAPLVHRNGKSDPVYPHPLARV